MKFHLFHFTPTGLVRAYSHLIAGYKLCRATGNSMKGLFPESVNSMTAAWNFNQTLKSKSLPPPRTIIDVGANISQMAQLLTMSCPEQPKILSFEPNTLLTPRLGTIFRVALSNTDGEVSFYLPSNDDSWGTIEPGKENQQNAKTIAANRFDTLLNKGELKIADLPRPILVKIDTEGSEMRVVEGFGERLNLVDYLLVEVENDENRGHHYDLLTFSSHLKQAGFNHSKVLYACYDGHNVPAYNDILFWK